MLGPEPYGLLPSLPGIRICMSSALFDNLLILHTPLLTGFDVAEVHGYSGWMGTAIKSALSIGRLPLARLPLAPSNILRSPGSIYVHTYIYHLSPGVPGYWPAISPAPWSNPLLLHILAQLDGIPPSCGFEPREGLLQGREVAAQKPEAICINLQQLSFHPSSLHRPQQGAMAHLLLVQQQLVVQHVVVLAEFSQNFLYLVCICHSPVASLQAIVLVRSDLLQVGDDRVLHCFRSEGLVKPPFNFRGWIAGFNPLYRLLEIRTLGYLGILAISSSLPFPKITCFRFCA